MAVTKIFISKQISKDLSLSIKDASFIMESFLSLIKINSKTKKVKLSSFGTFNFKKSPQRIGRNPKTKESYIINATNRLNFKPSSKIKESINWRIH